MNGDTWENEGGERSEGKTVPATFLYWGMTQPNAEVCVCCKVYRFGTIQTRKSNISGLIYNFNKYLEKCIFLAQNAGWDVEGGERRSNGINCLLGRARKENRGGGKERERRIA